MSRLEELARKLVDALNDAACASHNPNDPPDIFPADVEKATEELDQYLLDIGKVRETSGPYIEHAKKMAAAYEDFDVDENPEVMVAEGNLNQRWIACWMRSTRDPETGEHS